METQISQPDKLIDEGTESKAAQVNPARKDDAFQIGLCMAGAVSAGAYTAGVIDYLIEALDAWEEKKESARKGEANDVPMHQVEIPIIGGASAGGMTGIMTASILHKKFPPVTTTRLEELKKVNDKNPLFHSWVDLTDHDMFPKLLATDDIGDHKIYSLLNSKFIDEVAARAISDKPEPFEPMQRPYIPEDLKVFTTLSNLGGFVKKIPFTTGSNTASRFYVTTRHSDFACFRLGKNEPAEPGWIPLRFYGDNMVNTDIARAAAMATGAFPVGLRSRTVKRLKSDVQTLPWLLDSIDLKEDMNDPYEMQYVDGGLINNEPFDKVRQAMIENTKQLTEKDAHDYKTFKGTIVMVDPFPSEQEKYENGDELFKVVGSTLSAMLGHLRIKPREVEDAMNADLAGQFLIAPSRPEKKKVDGKEVNEEVDGSKAIACGCFGGFGGFFDHEFRIHDFLLGRANCEKFLRDHFTIPVKDGKTGNPIFDAGYQNVSGKSRFTSKTDGGLQIIPIFTEQRKEFPMPVFENGKIWPVKKERDIDRFRPLLKARAQAILLNLEQMGWLSKSLLWIGAKLILNGKAAKMSLNAFKSALRNHRLLE